MFRSIVLAGGACAALGISILAVSAASAGSSYQPLPVTGTWTGSLKCKGLGTGGMPNNYTIEITEVRMRTGSEGQLAVEFDAAAVVSAAPALVLTDGLCGATTTAGGDPAKGNVVMSPITAFDGTTVDFQMPIQAVSAKGVKLYAPKNGVSGKMKGVAVTIPNQGIIGQCKLKLQRTNDALPVMNSALLSACGLAGA